MIEQKGLPINIRRLFPFLQWPRPTARSLRRDAWAGISVGLVLIPQAVAYATLAGMPPQTGLYAALLPSIIGILWGSSALLAVGPVALTSLLTFGSLAPLAAPGSAEWVVLAIWLSLYAGCIQILLGAFRLGRIADIVSQPVVIGFIGAAALIIIISQLPALFGIGLSFEKIAHVMNGAMSEVMPVTSAFGCAALILLLAFKRFLPRFPGILIVTVLGIVASWVFDYAGHGGAIVGAIPPGIPPFALPSAIPFARHQELWPAALILALISFTEAMSSCRILARKRNEQWDENQELIGQGLAKITGGFCGTFPVSGSFSRSALNLYAGATSAWSTLFSALCVWFCLLYLIDFLYYLPRSVLAAMIMVPVFGLLDFRAFRRLFSISRDEGVIAVVTFAVTLLSTPRLHWGVLVGVGLTMVFFLYRRAHPRIVEVGQHQDGTLRDRSRFNLPRLAPNVLAVRLDSALNFLTAAMLERYISERVRADGYIHRVLLCAGSINDIDVSGIETLEALQRTLQDKGIDLYLSAIKKQVWDVLDKAGMINMLGSDRIFATDAKAILAMNMHISAPVRSTPIVSS